MTVRAEQSEVLEAVVLTPTIDVIEFKRHRAIVPALRSADFAFGTLQAFLDEPDAKVVGLGRSFVYENFCERQCWCNGPAMSASPSLAMEVRRVQIQ
jgi:hypothetical protein